jgi:hypothetical protein
MPRRQDALDDRPGSIPDIRTTGRGVTFEMHPLGTRDTTRLIIRCDEAGEVWIAIRSESTAG